MKHSINFYFLISVLLIIVFLFGILFGITGKYPSAIVQNALNYHYDHLREPNVKFFGRTLSSGPHYFEADESLKNLGERLEKFSVEKDDIDKIVDVKINVLRKISKNIFYIDYLLNKKTYKVFFYSSAVSKNCKIIYIPGAGSHQAYQIFHRNKANYHNRRGLVLEAFKFCQILIPIYFNEGFLAQHNGSKALNWNHLKYVLLRDHPTKSIRAKQLTDLAALSLFAQKNAKKVALIGMSSGSIVAGILPAYFKYDAVFFSSGLSLTIGRAIGTKSDNVLLNFWGTQVYIRDYMRKFRQNVKAIAIAYGTADPPLPAAEASSMFTCTRFRESMPTQCFNFAGKHVFPSKIGSSWLKEVIIP